MSAAGLRQAAVLAGALALCAAAPLAAQTVRKVHLPAAPHPAPHAPAHTPEHAPEHMPPHSPGPIHLVSASETVWARGLVFGDPDAVVCLEEGEEVLLASDRITFHLLGKGCFRIGNAEEHAFAAEQRAHHTHLIEQAQAEHEAALASGDAAAADHAHARLIEARRKGAEHGAGLAPDGAATATTRRSAAAPRKRIGAVRDSTPAAPPRPVIFRLASASPAVLKRFPRGTLVQRTTAVCLSRGEEATIVGSNGQSVNYSGPGCLHRKARPTAENIGGFTFG